MQNQQSRIQTKSVYPSFFLVTLFTLGLSATLISCSSRTKRLEPGQAGVPKTVEFESNQLMMRSADEISEVVRKKIKRANAIQAQQIRSDDESLTPEEGAVRELREAMRIVLARPDQDGTRAAAFGRIRRELQDLNSVDPVLTEIGAEGIAALKSETLPTRRQATYLVVLENLMAEVRPEINSNAAFKKIIVDIRDANLQVTDALRAQARLNSMSRPVSPSETAKVILSKEAEPEKEKPKKKK